MRHINEVIIHCSDTPPKWMQGAKLDDQIAEIRRWHVEERGWSDIAYHYIIGRDGSVGFGRPLETAGAHTKGHNANSIGVCLIGGKGGVADGQFRDSFTFEQESALRKLIDDLQRTYPEITKVTGHNQHSRKACPCFIVGEWLQSGNSKQQNVRDALGLLDRMRALLLPLFQRFLKQFARRQ